MNDEKANWLSLNSYSSTFPTAVPKELVTKQEVKLHKKRKKKSKSNKKHKKKSKERVDSDFSSSSDSDINDDNINLVDSIDSTYQEIIHLPNGDTIIKEKKLSVGDVSWKIDKQKDKEINQYDIPKYRLDIDNSKSESKQLLRYYDDDHKASNTTINNNNSLKLKLKHRIDSDKLNPFNYILYSNLIISSNNDRIEYIYKIMENLFMEVTNTSMLVFYIEIINLTWHKSDQTFDIMDRIIKRALNIHPMSYDLYNFYFYISRSYFLSNNYCIEDIKQNYRNFASNLLDSFDNNRAATSSLVLNWCKESILIDFYITNHASILHNLSNTEHIIAYIQGLIEYNLLLPVDSINTDETLIIFENYWDSEYFRIGETDRFDSSITFWLNNNKPNYLPGNIFDYGESMNMKADQISIVHQKYPLTIFSGDDASISDTKFIYLPAYFFKLYLKN